MDHRTLDLIATVMDACSGERASGRRRGHPPAETVRVLATNGGVVLAFSRAFFLRCRSRAQRTFALSPRPIAPNRKLAA